MKIAVNKPLTPNLEQVYKYLKTVHDNGAYTNFGPLYHELTDKLEDYLGVKNLLLVNNGTSALQVAYKTINMKRAICTPYSYVATASALAWENIEMEFSDIDPKSYCLDPRLVEERLLRSNEVDAIVATHVYGNPCDLDLFDRIKKRYGVNIVYDAAHAFGVHSKTKSVLNFGDAATLSFHATKIFHTVEGGAVTFHDKEHYEKAKRLISFNLDDGGEPLGAGINAKLSEYHCAVGLALMDNIDNILEYRVSLYEYYRNELKDHFQLQEWNSNFTYNGAYFPIVCINAAEKKKIILKLVDSGIQTREYFKPSLNPYFSKNDKCPLSEGISQLVVCLPLHYYLTFHDVKLICDLIKDVSCE